jgi:hypothetical protein
VVCDFAFASFADFGFDPFAVHAVLGEDEQEFVVEADGFVDLLVDFLAGGDVVGGEPTGASWQRTPAFWRSA